MRRGAGRTLPLLGSLVALALSLVLASAFGPVSVSLRSVVAVALHGAGADVSRSDYAILWLIRMPRGVVLALVGGALSVCGATLQSTFRNPMADPAILGVSGGAALGAVLAVKTGFDDTSLMAVTLAAFVGALASALLVYLLAHVAVRPSLTSLLLTGVALSSLTSACVSLVLTWTNENDLKEILFWLVGGAQEVSWDHLRLASAPVLAGVALLWWSSRTIDALALGEEHALSVGVAVDRMRLLVLVLCALVAGAGVAVAGPIAFVGLMVPNGLRLMVGARAGTLIPVSFLGGGAFLVLCDLLGRVAFGAVTVPVGIITALMGVPFFMWLLVRSRRMS